MGMLGKIKNIPTGKQVDSGKRNFLKLIAGLGIIAGAAFVLRKFFGTEEVIAEQPSPLKETHTIYSDVISERTAASGVTVDGVLLKDGAIDANDIPTTHSGSSHAGRVTYENLNTNGDVGTASTQVSRGNHTH